MNFYLGVDLGTSSIKLLLVNEQGEILNTSQKEYTNLTPKPFWSEQDPEIWWEAFIDCFFKVTENISVSDIKAIGVSGQMHGLVVLDQSDRVIRPAILWNDGRTEKEVDYLNSVIGKDRIMDYTANIAFTGFTAPKLLWLKNNEPENFNKIHKIMLPKDYLNYRLTGVHSCDYSDASGSLLLDVKNKRWSREMLEICQIPASVMPELYNSYESIGTVTEEISAVLGLAKDVFVVAGAGDNAAAAIACGAVGKGKCNISIGTSGTVFVSSDIFGESSNNTIHSFCHADGGFHLLGGIISAATCNKWFCKNILHSNDYGKLQEEIQDNMLGNNSVFFLPYLAGERSPINDANARGVFFGLTDNTNRTDMLLAVMEGVAFAIKDICEAVNKIGININVSGLCGGGAKSKIWQKIFCNVLNMKIHIPYSEEGPGYGAAMLAMVGSGEFESVEQCVSAIVKVKTVICPDVDTANRYYEKYKKFSLIYPALKNIF